MIDYKITIGVILTIINLLILFLLAYNIIKCYVKAINVDKVTDKKDVDHYFGEIFISMVFFFANVMALYTGYKAYILNPQMIMLDIVNYRLADRVGMLLVAILMNWKRNRYNPFNDI